MGGIASRRSAGVEEVDISTNNAYRYPPRSGCYFGSHFIMGGERFETTQPEAYLFGDNQDLNFLGNRPIPFPYPAPQAHEPTKTLKSLVNIRKDSLKFIKVASETAVKKDDDETTNNDRPLYNIEFTFDSDVRVAITIYYFATEEINNGHAVYNPKDATMNSETFHYKRGANQTFSQSTHVIDPGKFPEEEWQYNPDKEVLPVVIHCVVEDEVEYLGHSHILLATVDKTAEQGYVLKPLKQKQMVDGLCYLLQEIYGIENKNTDRKLQDDDMDDNGSECVICMSDTRDTLILPCRHLCLCNCCADNLRYQANNCPICRAPFRALLQIRAMRKKVETGLPPPPPSSDGDEVSQEGVPPGYEAVSLLEALNGPNAPSQPTLPVPVTPSVPVSSESTGVPPSDDAILTDATLKRQGSSHSTTSRHSIVTTDPERAATPEVVMSASAPDPVKPTPDKVKKSKGKKKATSAIDDAHCEVVNELATKTASDSDVPTEASHNVDEDTPDSDDFDTLAAVAVVATPHTAIVEIPEKKPSEDEDEPLCLPGKAKEGSGDANDGSGSSYSSTNSANGLLDDKTEK